MRPSGREPGFLTSLKWSAAMVLVTLAVAAISIPLLRLLDLD